MKKSLKLIITLVMMMAMVTALFAGCAGEQSEQTESPKAEETAAAVEETAEDTSEESAVSSEPLTVLMWLDGDALAAETKVFDKITEETGQEFEIITCAYDDLEKKLGTMIQGGEPPAITRNTTIVATKFRDKFVPLDYDTEGMVPYFFNNSNGEIINLPVELTTVGMFINTDIADKYGVNYPTDPSDVWTWEEFETEMKKVVGQPDVDFPMTMDGSGHRYSSMFYQHGALPYGGDFADLGIDSPEAIYSFENYKRLVDEKVIDPQTYSIGTSGDGLFTTGRYLIHMSGSWQIQRYVDGLDFNFAVTYMPQGDGGRSTVLGGSSYSVLQGSGQEEAALAVLDWMADKDNLLYIGETITQLTAVQNAEVDYGIYSDYFTKFGHEMSATKSEYVDDFNTLGTIPGAYNYIKDAIIEVLGEMKTPEEALTNAAELMQQAAADAGME